ncbi:hypothetical protein [Brevundimonas sp.]|uniref:hypothetical protein n=1 Tax=Brevundimonas sp. TaxID=1871086 RepID=UPI002C8FA56B|nr:hypothetical protein [Brevundimonas sp.]HWQ88332.1 hypothetical protein [Brevundimonas sp.]
MMFAVLVALLGSSPGAEAAEDWRLVDAGPDFAYGIDRDSIVLRGSVRAFVAVSVEADGYGKARLIADCADMTIRVQEDLSTHADQSAVENTPRAAVGSELSMVNRVCRTWAEGGPRETKISFEQFLETAKEFIGVPMLVPCGPPPHSRYARSREECVL